MKNEHIFMGFHAERGYPILLSPQMFQGHMHILGGSGSRKTSAGALPLLDQLIRMRRFPIIVLDLKPDIVLEHHLRRVAHAVGVPFKCFSNVPGHPTNFFDAFGPLNDGRLAVNQVASVCLQAFRVWHGDGYGRSYFSRACRMALTSILRRYPRIESFGELHDRMSTYHFESDKLRGDAMELVEVISSLASMPQLNPTGQTEAVRRAAIRMAEVIENNQVAYFGIASTLDSGAARECGNLVVANAMVEASLRARKKETFFYIDEFPALASRAFEPMLEQARSFGLNFIVANQAIAQLKTHDAPALKGVVETSTRVKWYFSANEPEVLRALELTSGNSPFIESFYCDGAAADEDFRPRVRVGSRHNITDILRYSATPDLSIMQVARDEGLSQYGGLWFGVKTLHAMSFEEYQRLSDLPWPEGEEGTIIAGAGRTPEPSGAGLTPVEREIKKPAAGSQWAKRLNEVAARKDGPK